MDIELIGFDLAGAWQKETKQMVRKILAAACLDGYSINICLVKDDHMLELCRNFKKKNQVTDVLSFPVPASEQEFAHTKNFLGDLVICVDQANRQAVQYGHSLKEEIAVLVAHGLFHLLGYDHEASKQDESMQMQGEMFLLEKAGLRPEIGLVGRTIPNF